MTDIGVSFEEVARAYLGTCPRVPAVDPAPPSRVPRSATKHLVSASSAPGAGPLSEYATQTALWDAPQVLVLHRTLGQTIRPGAEALLGSQWVLRLKGVS